MESFEQKRNRLLSLYSDQLQKASVPKEHLKEMIDEHERLVRVLEANDPKEVKEEAKEQKKELKEYKETYKDVEKAAIFNLLGEEKYQEIVGEEPDFDYIYKSEIENLNRTDMEKGKKLPIGTIKDRGNGKFIKTADGWKYHSPSDKGKKFPKKFSFKEILEDRSEGGGRELIERIEEYISDLRDQPGRKEHIDGLRQTVEELEKKTGYKYDIREQEQAYRKIYEERRNQKPVAVPATKDSGSSILKQPVEVQSKYLNLNRKLDEINKQIEAEQSKLNSLILKEKELQKQIEELKSSWREVSKQKTNSKTIKVDQKINRLGPSTSTWSKEFYINGVKVGEYIKGRDYYNSPGSRDKGRPTHKVRWDYEGLKKVLGDKMPATWKGSEFDRTQGGPDYQRGYTGPQITAKEVKSIIEGYLNAQ